MGCRRKEEREEREEGHDLGTVWWELFGANNFLRGC